MESKKNIGAGKQTIYVIIGKLLALVSTLAIPLILTRYISKEEYGLFSQFNTITLFVTSIFSLGIQTNLYYFFPNESFENKRIYIFQTFIMLLLLSIIAMSVFNIPLINNFLMGDGEINKYKSYITIGIFLLLPTMMLEALYVVKKDLNTSLLYPPIQSFLKIASILIVILIFNANIETVLKGVIIAFILPFLFSILYLNNSLKSDKKSNKIFSFSKLILQLKYSIPYGSAVILNTIIRRIDKIICISYLTTTEYAVYSIAFIGIPGIQQIYEAISQIIIVKIVEAVKEGKQNKVLDLYKQLVSKTFSYTIPLIIIVGWYSRDIIEFLFTPDYTEATPFFQLYLTSFIVGMLGAGIIIRATGKTKLTFKAYLYSAILIIPISFYLISQFGIWGAITTALLGAFIPKLIMIYMEMKIIGCKLSEYLPWRNLLIILTISIVTLIPVIIIDSIFNRNIFLIAIISFFYLVIVSLIEIIFNVFAVNKKYIKENILMLQNKFGLHKF